jgi:hypothetical protein
MNPQKNLPPGWKYDGFHHYSKRVYAPTLRYVCAKYCAENVKSGDHLWMLEVGLSE